MSDPYFKPKTIAKCHDRIDGLLHTNKTQAETIGEFRIECEKLKLKAARAEAEREIFRIKWSRLLKMHQGLKAVLSTLSANSDDFEEYNKSESDT